MPPHLVQTLVRDADELFQLRRGFADHERLVEVAVEAVLDDRNINVDGVALLELALVRNSVADDLIHTGAHRLREIEVAQRRGVRAGLHAGLMHHAVDLVCGGARAHGAVRGVEHFAPQAARGAHAPDLRRVQDGRRALVGRGLLLLRVASVSVVGPRDGRGHGAVRRDGRRPQLARPVEGRDALGAVRAALDAVAPLAVGWSGVRGVRAHAAGQQQALARHARHVRLCGRRRARGHRLGRLGDVVRPGVRGGLGGPRAQLVGGERDLRAHH